MSDLAEPAHPAVESACAAANRDLDRLVHEVEDAAHAWGIRRGHPEWKFCSAILGTAAWLGKLTGAATVDMRKVIDASKEAAAVEIRKLNLAVEAAELHLAQTRETSRKIEADRTLFIADFVKTVTPDLVRSMSNAIVLREKRLHRNRELLRYGVVSGLTLLVFLGGYIWRATQDEAAIAALRRCRAEQHQERVTGEWVCSMSILVPDATH